MVARSWQQMALGITLAALAVGCSSPPSSPGPGAATLDAPEIAQLLDGIQASQIKQHMSTLADDALEGRGLGSAGYEGALRYVETAVKSYGLAPAGEGGGFRQAVPLRNSAIVEDASSMAVTSAAGKKALVYGKDYLLGADPLRGDVRLDDAPVVFVGYGVSAPALGYDDYGTGVDVKDKVVAYLSGAPARLPSNERAYYSSGAAKEAEAIKRGAIGTISFTSPDDPRFRWDVSVATGKQGGYAWIDAQGNPNRGDPALRGSASLNHSGVAALFAGAPKPPADIFAAAAASTPQAFDLPTRVTIVTRSTHRDVGSANLVARLEGSDPALRNEHVVYIAHVDHFGRGVPMNGDDIYNGAHDNASGVAIVLEVARTYAALPTPPRRSVLFLFVTAEERGLLGSDYFARHPTVPGEGIVADLALDMPFLFHPLLDIVPYGAQHSTLSTPVTRAAERLGIAIATDPIPEQVLFIRSDHFSFVRQGVPSLFIKSGFLTGDPAKDGAAINAAYRRDVYHKPNDDMSQPFDFEAGAAHARLNFLTGWQVAQDPVRPAWNPGDFFGQLFGPVASKDTGTAPH
jgi:Zn-dependent M28 family amino/carboxypeptidase